MHRLCAALLALMASAAGAHAESLAELLEAVGANARFDVPTRADVRIECSAGCAASGGRAIILGRGDRLYVEVKGGQRALILPDKVLVAEGGKAAEATPGRPLADTDVLLEDLRVFAPASLKMPQISDDGPAGVVVTAAPAGRSAYVLLVHTIDRDQRSIVRTLYYRDAINALSKVRRDGGFVRVGRQSRPGEITVETTRQETSTRLKLAWREVPDAPPLLFESAGLQQPSGLSWP
jgi:hypothetical protein